jgi:hypothetical protein
MLSKLLDLDACSTPTSLCWFCGNWQTEACLILRPKSRNCPGDFEAQITKPELPILRPKSGKPPPPWFWGLTKKPTTGFEAKPGETIATSFEAKLEKTVTTGFQAKAVKTIAAGFDGKLIEIVAAGFEVKLPETVATGFEAKPVKTIDLSFEAQPRNLHS